MLSSLAAGEDLDFGGVVAAVVAAGSGGATFRGGGGAVAAGAAFDEGGGGAAVAASGLTAGKGFRGVVARGGGATFRGGGAAPAATAAPPLVWSGDAAADADDSDAGVELAAAATAPTMRAAVAAPASIVPKLGRRRWGLRPADVAELLMAKTRAWVPRDEATEP